MIVGTAHASSIACFRGFRPAVTMLVPSASACPAMNRVRGAILFSATVALAPWSFAAADVVAPNGHLKAEGIPAIPAELASRVARYTEFKPTTVVSWHPVKRELIVARRADNLTQLHRVSAAGREPKQLTSFPDPVRFGAYFAKKPDTLIFSRDTGGNEQRQIYRMDAADAAPVLLTDSRRKNDPEGFTHARDLLLVATTDV